MSQQDICCQLVSILMLFTDTFTVIALSYFVFEISNYAANFVPTNCFEMFFLTDSRYLHRVH